MPVISASRGLAMQECLRHGDAPRGRQHLGAQRVVGEGHDAVGDLGVRHLACPSELMLPATTA